MAGRIEAGESPARRGGGEREREKRRMGEFRGLFLRGERILLSRSLRLPSSWEEDSRGVPPRRGKSKC